MQVCVQGELTLVSGDALLVKGRTMRQKQLGLKVAVRKKLELQIFSLH
jgi:hypothetical protein